MDEADLVAIRGTLERFQDPTLSRRDRDHARRLALRWLAARGHDLRENSYGDAAIGTWEDPEHRSGRFQPRFHIHLDGTVHRFPEVEPFFDDLDAEGAMTGDEADVDGDAEEGLDPAEVESLKTDVDQGVLAGTGTPDEIDRLMGLLDKHEMLWQALPRWESRVALFTPILERLRTLGTHALERAFDAWSPHSATFPILVEMLRAHAEAHPDWMPTERIATRLMELSGLDHLGETSEDACAIVRRLRGPMDDALRLIATRHGASFAELFWAQSCLEDRRDDGATRVLGDALETWRQRRDYGRVEILVSAYADCVPECGETYFVGLAREGVAHGEDMLETWEAAMAARERQLAYPELAVLAEAGVDIEAFRLAAAHLSLVHRSHMDRRTGAIRFLPPPWEEEEALDHDQWWEIPGIDEAHLKGRLSEFAGGLPDDLTEPFRCALRSVFFLRDASHVLLGHAEAWITLQELRWSMGDDLVRAAARAAAEMLGVSQKRDEPPEAEARARTVLPSR